MSKAAKQEALEELHAGVANLLTKIVTDGRTEKRVMNEVEVTITTQASAADLAAAINFLTRNKIECAPGIPSKPVKQLAEAVKKLPFPAHPGGESGEPRSTH